MNPPGGRRPAFWGQVRSGAQDFLVKEASSHQPGPLGTPQGTWKAALLRPGGLEGEEGSGRGVRGAGEEERSEGMRGEVGRSGRQEGAPSPPCPHLWSQEGVLRQPEQDGGASRCHDGVPSAGGPCAPVGREDPTLLSSHTGTRLHTSDPNHRGPPNTFMHEHPRAQRSGLGAQRGRVGGQAAFVLVSQVLGQRTDRRPPIPCHLPERDSFQTSPAPQSSFWIRTLVTRTQLTVPKETGDGWARVSGVRYGWIRASSQTRSVVGGSAQQPSLTPVQPWTSQDCVSLPRLGLTVSGGCGPSAQDSLGRPQPPG